MIALVARRFVSSVGQENKGELMLGSDEIKKLAMLARLNVTEAEASKLQTQLGSILGYIGQFDKVDVAAVAPTSHAQADNNVFRDDRAVQSLSSRDVTSMAPDSSGNYIRVPIIIEQE